MAFTEDLSVFFDTGDFAIAAAYDGDTTVNVIFDRAFINSVTGVFATNPVAMVVASDIDEDPTGKTLLISGTTYTIRKHEPQDDGAVTLLHLET
jgi:hypothetical protein